MIASVSPRPEPVFVGEHLAMDFLNSIENPAIPNADWLSDGDGFVGWLRRAGLAGEAERAALGRLAAADLDAAAAEATRLREWFRTLLLERDGRPFTARDLPDLEPLNRLLARDAGSDQVAAFAGPDGKGVRVERVTLWDRADQLLQPVARAMAALVCDEDMSLVRTCGGPTCTLMFLDRTKSHRRRWCSMAVCGNRAKAATHRARAGKPDRGHDHE